jgi:hypothetical protein
LKEPDELPLLGPQAVLGESRDRVWGVCVGFTLAPDPAGSACGHRAIWEDSHVPEMCKIQQAFQLPGYFLSMSYINVLNEALLTRFFFIIAKLKERWVFLLFVSFSFFLSFFFFFWRY